MSISGISGLVNHFIKKSNDVNFLNLLAIMTQDYNVILSFMIRIIAGLFMITLLKDPYL
ncbi:hypothetical protein GCM10007161_17790 [Ignatzschineria indica]|nr:hypothetical protein GCM10007161_17790 [Ignatzschineria indica]